MKMAKQSILETPAVEQLLTLVEEAARAADQGVKRFIEPAQGALRRASSKRHHVVFGRRGSGKSSLLRKAAADLTVDRRPIAYVDLEAFKARVYGELPMRAVSMVGGLRVQGRGPMGRHVHTAGELRQSGQLGL